MFTNRKRVVHSGNEAIYHNKTVGSGHNDVVDQSGNRKRIYN